MLDPTREQARRWATEELAKGEYARARPGPVQRALTWLWDQIRDLLSQLPAVSGSGWALAAVAVIVVLVIGYAIWRSGGIGPVRPTAGRGGIFGDEAELTSAEHRAAADRAVAQGDWETAVVERFRAIVRQLEERTLLAPRPGRTAGEVASEIRTTLPDLADQVSLASDIFGAVRYGGRAATRESALQVQSVDEALGAARPVLA